MSFRLTPALSVIEVPPIQTFLKVIDPNFTSIKCGGGRVSETFNGHF